MTNEQGGDGVSVEIARDSMKYSVAWDLLDLRHQHGLRFGQVALVKKMVEQWTVQRDALAHHVLLPLLKTGVSHKEVAAALAGLPLFAGL